MFAIVVLIKVFSFVKLAVIKLDPRTDRLRGSDVMVAIRQQLEPARLRLQLVDVFGGG
jgi:hypothetical protein